jgi:hypothetical protein
MHNIFDTELCLKYSYMFRYLNASSSMSSSFIPKLQAS